MRRATVAVTAGVIVLGAVLWLLPGLTRDHVYPAEIPSPAAISTTSLVELPAGGRACWRYAVAERHAGRAVIKVSTAGHAGQPLRLSMTGPGYASRSAIRGGYRDDQQLTFSIARPPRDVVVLTCLRNAGRRAVGLYASRDRTRSRSLAVVDGRPTGASVWFALYEGRPASLLDRAGATVSRMSAFRAGIVGPWLLWPLALLFVLGVPALVVWAVWLASADDLVLEPGREGLPADVGGDEPGEGERVAGRGDGGRRIGDGVVEAGGPD